MNGRRLTYHNDSNVLSNMASVGLAQHLPYETEWSRQGQHSIAGGAPLPRQSEPAQVPLLDDAREVSYRYLALKSLKSGNGIKKRCRLHCSRYRRMKGGRTW